MEEKGKRFAPKEKKEIKKGTKYVVIFLILVVLAALAIVGAIYYRNMIENAGNKEPNPIDIVEIEPETKEPEKTELDIFKGDSRPIAVMIDNEKGAWPQTGLNDAYLLYEIIIEGGESRIMALFKGQETKTIGPIRSSRHYFLDYAMENDAIYCHFGWSPLAQSDIKTYKINNINGIYDDYYWRVEPKSSYHNAMTSMENITKYATNKKYRQTSEDEGVFKYSLKELELENGKDAKEIQIKYSGLHSVSYKYNEETKLYERYMRGEAHKDRYSDEQFVAKNIIVCYIRNALLDDPEDKGRQELYNIGSGNGVFITNGKYEDIRWEKKSREAKTKYYDKEDNEIVLNDGITWVQIVPVENKIVIN